MSLFSETTLPAAVIDTDSSQQSASPTSTLAASFSERNRALLSLGFAMKKRGYRFITVTPATHSRVNAQRKNKWAENLTDVFGWSRPFRKTAMDADILERMNNAGILLAHEDGWRSAMRLSSLGEQLYFHSAYPTDTADAVFFGPDTYRFIRALNAELTLLAPTIRRAADIGCGAGPGAISVALACPQAEVLAIDINNAALQLTAMNAVLANTMNVVPLNSNLLNATTGEFDLIISNPPYLLDASERAYRHGGGDLGTGLSLAIVDAAVKRLSPGGTLLLYTGVAIVDGVDPFLCDVKARLANADFDWHYEEIDPDVFGEELEEPTYAHIDRIAAVWLKATRRSQR